MLRQVRGQSPVDDDRRLSVVLAVADQNRRSTETFLPLLVGVLLNFVGVGVSSGWQYPVWLQLLVGAAFLVSVGLLARDYQRAGSYLDTYGGHPTTDS